MSYVVLVYRWECGARPALELPSKSGYLKFPPSAKRAPGEYLSRDAGYKYRARASALRAAERALGYGSGRAEARVIPTELAHLFADDPRNVPFVPAITREAR